MRPITAVMVLAAPTCRHGPTREVWYYEQPLPEGRKNYTKTAPIQFEEFSGLLSWWDQPSPGTKRKENERAWKVPAAVLLANGCNLDRKNPRAKEDITHLPPAQLAAGGADAADALSYLVATKSRSISQRKLRAV